MENLKLWKSVFQTDPSAVKAITGKTYQGNSPKPFWLIERATRAFGACGIGWGIEVVSERFQQVSADDYLHVATVRVWYIYEGKRGHVEQMGGTKAAYKSSAGKLIIDEDAGKKSVTDAMVKCLSMIGFAGDIFSGRWDDSKYVESAKQHFAEEKAQDAAPKTISPAQRDEIQTLLTQAGIEVAAFCEFIKLESLILIPLADFEGRKAQLLKKINKAESTPIKSSHIQEGAAA